VGGSSFAQVNGAGRFLPRAAADVAFDVSQLRSYDISESSIAELTK